MPWSAPATWPWIILGMPKPLMPSFAYGICTCGSTAATPSMAVIWPASARSMGMRPMPRPLVEPSVTTTLPT